MPMYAQSDILFCTYWYFWFNSSSQLLGLYWDIVVSVLCVDVLLVSHLVILLSSFVFGLRLLTMVLNIGFCFFWRSCEELFVLFDCNDIVSIWVEIIIKIFDILSPILAILLNNIFSEIVGMLFKRYLTISVLIC